MKKNIIAFFNHTFTVFNLSILLAVLSSNGFANEYSTEINSLQDRERTYVDEATRELTAIKRFENSWVRLRFAINRIANKTSLGSAPSLDENNLSKSRIQLLKIAHETAVVDLALSSLESGRPEIEVILNELTASAAEFPALESNERSIRNNIENQLNSIQHSLIARRDQVKLASQRWIEWELNEYNLEILTIRREVLSDLEFEKALYQVKSPLVLAKRDVTDSLQSIYELNEEDSEDELEHAQHILDGMIWLRSQVPIFFAGKLSDPERAAKVDRLLKVQEAEERILSSKIAKHRVLKAMTLIAQNSGSSLIPRLRFAGPLSDMSTRSSSGFYKIPPNEAKTPSHRWEGNLEGVGRVEGQQSNKIEKKILEYQPQVTSKAELGGFVIVDGMPPNRPESRQRRQEYVPLESNKNLIEAMNRELLSKLAEDYKNNPPSFRKLPDTPQNEAPPESLKNKLSRVDKLIDRAKQIASDPQEKLEIDELSKALNRFKEQHNHFEKKLRESTNELKYSREITENELNNLKKAAESQLQSHLEELVKGVFVSESDLNEASKRVADFYLGFTPAAQAYDFGNFISSFTTGINLLGQPTTQTDQMLYAVGAIIPYFSQISHLVKATHIVTVFNKTGKVVGVASRSDRKLLKTLVNSLENTSPEAKSFVVRLFNHSKRSPEELERIAKRYTEIQSKMKHVIGVKFKVTVMRGVNPEHLPVGASSADRTSEIFQKRVSEMDHRFTLSGDEDTYATVVERTIKETEEIINLETGRLKNKYAIKNLQIENALDLTKPGTLEQLGLSEDLVRTSIEVSSQAYEITQQIGDLARKLGFDAVIFHSAEVTGAKNIVIFNK